MYRFRRERGGVATRGPGGVPGTPKQDPVNVGGGSIVVSIMASLDVDG